MSDMGLSTFVPLCVERGVAIVFETKARFCPYKYEDVHFGTLNGYPVTTRNVISGYAWISCQVEMHRIVVSKIPGIIQVEIIHLSILQLCR